jgi:ferritin
MLSKKIQNLLNDQIRDENFASHYYLAMASWCEKQGLQGAAGFLYGHSVQEKEHMMKLFRYVNDAGGHALVKGVKEPAAEFKSLLDVMNLVLKHEQGVTASINALVDACLAEKDYSTFNFLQWYVSEQHEEERLFHRIIDMIKLTGTDGRGLFLADREIGKYGEKKGESK